MIYKWNDTVWSYIMGTLDHVSHNTMYILLASCIPVLIISCFYKMITSRIKFPLVKKKRNPVPFGPLMMLYVRSAAYAVDRLPLIHPRIHRALSTVSSVLGSSKTYTTDFEACSGITVQGEVDVVSYLYGMTRDQMESWHASPSMLYDSLFRVLQKDRWIPLSPDVHMPCLLTISVPFFLCCFLILLFGFLALTDDNKLRRFLFPFQAAFVLYLCSLNTGSVYLACFLWFVDEVFYFFRTSDNFSEKHTKTD